jgi:hypothetical protein
MAKKLDHNNSGLRNQLTRIEDEIQAENNQLKVLSEDMQLLKSVTLTQKVDSFSMFAFESFEGLKDLVDSATTPAELQAFCEHFKLTMDEKVAGMVHDVSQLVDQNQISPILAQLEAIGSYMKDKADQGRLEDYQKEVKGMIEELNNAIVTQVVSANLKLDTVSAAIENILQQKLSPPLDSLGTALDGRLKSIEELVAAQNLHLLPEFRKLCTEFNLHDGEMKEMIEGVVSDLQAVRNFQDLSVHEAQRYPFLFIISEQKLKESLRDSTLGNIVRGVRESGFQHYCVHFACNVCGGVDGCVSPPKPVQKKGFWRSLREKISVVDQGQGGYQLTVMRKSLFKFLKYAHIILSLLDLGAKLAGVNLSQLVSTVSHELNIADDMRRLAEAIGDEKWIPQSIQNKV